MRNRQQGMTFIGLLILLGVVGLIGYGVIRLVPVYLNYMKVTRTMEQVATEFKGDQADPARMLVALDRHWTIEDITEISPKDIEIVKDENGLSMHAEYDHKVDYIGNVFLLVHFDKTVKVE